MKIGYRLSDLERQKRILEKVGEAHKINELQYRIAYYEKTAQALKKLQMGYDEKLLQDTISNIYKETQKAREKVLHSQDKRTIEKIDIGITNMHHIIVEEYERLKITNDIENILFLCLITLDAIRDKICNLALEKNNGKNALHTLS